MKKLSILLIMILVSRIASAQFFPADEGSSIAFKIKNFGFDVNGKFTGMQGKIDFDPQNSSNGHFDVKIDAASVNTDNSLRDKHLKGESYFNTTEFPFIHFISTNISPGPNKGMFILTGELTIKNIAREIQFPFVAMPLNDGYIFKGSFKIKRKDFNIGGTSTISDELEVMVAVTAKKLNIP